MTRKPLSQALVLFVVLCSWSSVAFADRAPAPEPGRDRPLPRGGAERGEWPPPPGRGGPPAGPGDAMFPPPGPPPRPRMPPPAMLAQLGLSQPQRAKLDELHEAHMRTMIRGDADLRLAELDLHRLVHADRADDAAIDQAVDRVGAAQLAMLRSRVRMVTGLRGLLTVEQRARLDAFEREHGPR